MHALPQVLKSMAVGTAGDGTTQGGSASGDGLFDYHTSPDPWGSMGRAVIIHLLHGPASLRGGIHGKGRDYTFVAWTPLPFVGGVHGNSLSGEFHECT